MNKKITIAFKTKTLLINEIIKQELVEVFKKPTFIKKLFKKGSFADIYFHSGSLDEKAIKNILNSKKVVVNSFSSLNQVLEKTSISRDKIEVIYPSINLKDKEPGELKVDYIDRLGLKEGTKLIFFTAKNFKTGGIKEFLEICLSLNYSNFKIIIAGNKQQMDSLEFLLKKYKKIEDKIIKVVDSKKLDELFLISDIFLLPTTTKAFSVNILKAMFAKCAIFIPSTNDAKEVVDVFATMNTPNDATVTFKIDAILNDENELEKVKNDNKKVAYELTLESNLEKIYKILATI